VSKLMWIVGKEIAGGWMPDALFETEHEAAEAATDGEFIACVAVGERFPAEAVDAIKLYWPRQETWEQSALFRMRA
jgi:hypothetical protein